MVQKLDQLVRRLRGEDRTPNDDESDREPGVGAAAGLPDDATLVAALDALGELGDPGAVEHICVVLGVTQPYPSDVHRAAIGALGRIGAPEAVESLIYVAAETGEEDDSREEARVALKALGRTAVDPLIAALRNAADDQERIAAIRALGAVGGSTVSATLERELHHAEDDLLVALAEALEEGGDPGAVWAIGERLVTTLERDTNRDPAVALTRAICKFGGPGAREPLLAALAAGILLAAKPLADAGERRALPSLLWWMEHWPGEPPGVLHALGRLGDPRGVLPLARRASGIPNKSMQLYGVLREEREVAREELERLCGALGETREDLITVTEITDEDGYLRVEVAGTTILAQLCEHAVREDAEREE